MDDIVKKSSEIKRKIDEIYSFFVEFSHHYYLFSNHGLSRDSVLRNLKFSSSLINEIVTEYEYGKHENIVNLTQNILNFINNLLVDDIDLAKQNPDINKESYYFAKNIQYHDEIVKGLVSLLSDFDFSLKSINYRNLIDNIALSSYEDIERNNSSRMLINQNIQDVKQDTKQLEKKLNVINDKFSQLEDLTAHETQKFSSKVFEDRSKKLNFNIFLWLVLALAMWGFVFYVSYSNIYYIADLNMLLIVSLKLVPLVIMASLFTSLYLRERNIKEEYTFKSIISLTISPMRDQVTDEKLKNKLTGALADILYESPLSKRKDLSHDDRVIKQIFDMVSKEKSEN